MGHCEDVDLDDLTHAQTAVTSLLESFDTDDWMRPSPCTDWGVATVVRHLVVGERAFATALGGTAYDLPALTDEVGQVPNVDLPRAYAEGAGRLRDALGAADPEATYPTGLGPMPPAAVDQLRTVEALVHGWDAGRGVGRLLRVDDGVAERAIERSLVLMEKLPPDRSPFAPPVEVGPDASPIDRLAALLGRDPNAVLPAY